MCYKRIKNSLVFILVFCSVALYAQRDTTFTDYSVYEYQTNDIDALYPSYEVEHAYENEWHVYRFDEFGVREYYPFRIVTVYNGDLYIYCVDKNGIREVNPHRVIRKQQN